VRALLFAVAVALLVSPALAASSRADGEGPRRGTYKVRAVPQLDLCPQVPGSRRQRRHRAAVLSLGSAAGQQRHRKARAGIKALAGMSYAVQFKAGLSKAERDAALATLRDKYKLHIVKFNKGLDILRLRPRAAPARAPKSLGAALTPSVIRDLRKEPFVDAAYVDFPVSPPRPPARRSRSKPAPATSRQPRGSS
jgi:hypothetical protein